MSNYKLTGAAGDRPFAVGNQLAGQRRAQARFAAAITISTFALLGAAGSAAAASKTATYAAAAQKFVTARESPATGIGLTTPLPKTPPRGKKIIYVECAEAVCAQIAEGLSQASQALGWTFSTVQAGSTPSAVQSTWNTVVQEDPDGVVASATPKALFAQQLAELAAKQVPYVVNSTTDSVGGGVTAVISGTPTYAQRGQWMARWATAGMKAIGGALFVGLSDYPIFVSEQNAFTNAYRRVCPGCSYSSTDISLSDLGTTAVPSSIVSAARSVKNLKYIVAATGELTEGLLPQLRSAGLGSVKVVSQAGLPANFESIADGSSEVADIPAATQMIGWMMADALARHFEGAAIPEKAYDTLPGYFMTKKNVRNPSQPYAGPPNFQAAFKKLWHLS